MNTIQAAKLSVEIVVDTSNAVQRLREIDQAGKQAAQSLQASLSTTFAAAARSAEQSAERAARAMQRKQDEMIRVAMAEARLAAATNDYEKSVQILQSALAHVTERTKQVIAAETQLARMKSYLNKESENLTRGMRVLTTTASTLQNAVGALGVALSFQSAAQAVQHMMSLAHSVEQAEVSLRAVAQTTQIADQAMRLAAQNQSLFGGSFAENIGIMQQFVMLSQRTNADLEKLLETARLLSVVNPAEGLEGAAFALSELLAGDITSIVERFNLSRDAVRALAAESSNAGQVLLSIQDLLAQQGVTTDALTSKLNTTAQAYVALSAAVEQAQIKLGSFVSSALAPAAVATTELINRLIGSTTAIDTVAQHILTSSSSYDEYVAAVSRANQVIQEHNSSLVNIPFEYITRLTEAQYLYAQALLSQGVAVEDAIQKARMFGVQMHINEDGTVTYTESTHALADAKAYLAEITAQMSAVEGEQASALAVSTQNADSYTDTLMHLAAEKIKARVESEQLTYAQERLEQALKTAASASASVESAVQSIVSAYNIEELKVYELVNAYRQLEAMRAQANYQRIASDAKISELRAERERVYAQRETERQQQSVTPRGSGGRGGRVRSVKVEHAEQERNELADVQRRVVQQTERYEDRLLQIQRDYAERARAALASFADTQVESRAQFYDRLAQIADQHLRQQLSVQYESAVSEAAALASALGADVAEKYLQEQTRIILARAERQKRIAEAAARGEQHEAEYLRGVDELYRQAEDRKLEQIKTGAGSLAEQQRQALAELDRQHALLADHVVSTEERKRAAIMHTTSALREQLQLMNYSASAVVPQPAVSRFQPLVPSSAVINDRNDMSLSAAVAHIERVLRDVQSAIERLRILPPVAL